MTPSTGSRVGRGWRAVRQGVFNGRLWMEATAVCGLEAACVSYLCSDALSGAGQRRSSDGRYLSCLLVAKHDAVLKTICLALYK